MRTLLLIFLYFLSGWVYSQEVPKNHATQLLLNAEPQRVEQLIKFAQTKWGDSKDSIAYEVEKQAYCYIMIYAMIGNPETTTEEQLIIRQEIMREVVESESIELERVDWFDVYRNVNYKLRQIKQ